MFTFPLNLLNIICIVNRAFFVESASPRDKIPSKYISTKKTIMQAEMFRESPTSDLDQRKFTSQKNVLNKNLFESFPSQDIAITHLKDDRDKSVLMEFPKSPFSSRNAIKTALKEANNQPLYMRNFVNKNLLMSLNSNLDNPQNNQNVANENYNRGIITSNFPYSWRQYSSAVIPSNPAALNDPRFIQLPSQSLFSNQESSLLSAKLGAARYEQNTKPMSRSAILSNKHLDSGMWEYV